MNNFRNILLKQDLKKLNFNGNLYRYKYLTF